MGLLDMFKTKPEPLPPQRAIEVIPLMSKRSERLDAQTQVQTFVSLGCVERSLLNTDNRVLFGRRGTGKAHVLSYLQDTVKRNGDLAISIDCRTVGSKGYLYNDASISVGERMTYLARDFVSAIYDALYDYVTDPHLKSSKKIPLDKIEAVGSSISEILVKDTFEREKTASEADKNTLGSEINGKLSAVSASVSARANISAEHSDNVGVKSTDKGHYRLSVSTGNVNRAFMALSASYSGRIWIVLDEWSTLPDSLQPYFADFIKRSILPIAKFTVVIAAIEQRSNFRIQSGSDWIGVELGSDMFADINLDDYLVFENDSKLSLDFFRSMIFSHLKSVAANGLIEKTPEEFVGSTFTQAPTFRELVRASEGVPRDAINILQLAAIKAHNRPISIPDVRNAARDWYDRDKASYVNSNIEASKFLSWIIEETIGTKKARAFLLRTDVKDPLMERLFDERILHIAKRSYSAKADPGTRYKVWKIDYGCYVDRINTSSAPTGFLFEGQDDEDDKFFVPEDDLRAIRRSVLDLPAFYDKQSTATPLNSDTST